ncbi:GIN domain-containing protein [Legionella septentrionalis]|uniref:GIN domain-containing protein n=1 Tax=Legionella septentrionalis TaxID=2498109 RepID=UPI000F8D7920|nr:DUF2807 domain-containing protein [Legionella septentrionalis]RUR16323.1 hypothetical protein ELY10_03785 [Legionella septentrionalis]
MVRQFLCFSVIFLIGCTRTVPPASVVKVEDRPLPAVTQHRPAGKFTSIRIKGIMNVSLHTGYARPTVILRGDPRDLAEVHTFVKNNTLFIKVGEGYPHHGGINAEIRGHFLNSFRYQGIGTITGTRLHSSLLDVSIDNKGKTTLGGDISLRTLDVKGSGLVQVTGIHSPGLRLHIAGKPKVQLVGVANLASLNIDDDAWMSLYWIKTKLLVVRARGNSFIQLAGVADRLDVELCGNAHFNGRYLRANRAFVKTHDQSIAEISAVKRQHTLASDASDIHFYNIPQMKADFMAFNGSVLDMRDWNMPFIQEYNRYNK